MLGGEWSEEETHAPLVKREKTNGPQVMLPDDESDDEALKFLDKPGMTEIHMCMECGSVFTKPSHLRQHELSHQRKSFMCAVEGCEKMYTRKDHLTRHIKMDHATSSDDDNVRTFKCTLCHQEFKYKHALTRHTKEVHDTTNAARPYVCTTCHQTFKKKSHLQEHSFVHTGKPPFPCAHCDAAFLKKYQLDAHSRRFHTTVVSLALNEDATEPPPTTVISTSMPVECDVCHQFFASKKTLHGHVQAVHRPKKEHPCPDCGNVYSTKPNLMKHIRAIHASGAAFPCDVCDQSFGYKHVLNKHKQAMHNTPRPEKRKRKPLDGAVVRARLTGATNRPGSDDS